MVKKEHDGMTDRPSKSDVKQTEIKIKERREDESILKRVCIDSLLTSV